MKSRRRRNSAWERSASKSEVRNISEQGGEAASPLEPPPASPEPPPLVLGPADPAAVSSPGGELLEGLARGLADHGGGIRRLPAHQRAQGLAEDSVPQCVGRPP